MTVTVCEGRGVGPGMEAIRTAKLQVSLQRRAAQREERCHDLAKVAPYNPVTQTGHAL